MMQKSVPPLRYPLCGRLTLVTALLVAARQCPYRKP